ncbi:MAG: PEP-utilizing enzyme, partial [Endomicrobia bacterium]|nr:PEP-utilizing enzyme [Endomicrobiia bacterium]
MAEFPAFRGNLDTTVWNFNVQHNNYGYLFENNDNFRDSRGRNWSDIRNELMSAWDFDSVQKSIQNLLNFAYAIASRMNEKHGEEFLMKVISEIYKLTEKIPFNMGKDIITLTPWEPSSQFDKYTSKKRDLQVDEFALFEKFIDFNRIALAELGSGDIASIENSKKALMEMINIIKVLESLIVLRPGEVKISVSEEAEKRLKNMTGAAELNGIINYVHQEGIKVIKTGGINGNAEVFEFKTIKTDIEAPRDSGYPNNEFNIKVYNYSQEPLTEHMIEFLSNLRLKGLPKEGAANFSLFIKNNTVIFDMSMGEHSVYFVMHLDDLNQGMYGVYNESHRKHGNNARAGLFAREAALLGADITRFDNLPAEINMDGTSDKTKELIIVLHKYMKELERENSDKSLLEEYIRSIHSLSNKNIYIADFILKTLSSKKAIDELSVLKIMVLFGNSDSLTNRKITLLSKKTLTEDERKELERINSALPHYNPRTQNSILKFNNFLSKVKLYIDAKKTKDSAAIQKAEENLKNYMEEISRVEDKDNEIIINVIEQILQGKEDVDISAYEKRLEYGFLKEQLEIINGILIKKYKKGIEEINEIPDVRISLYVPGAGGFNMFHRAGDVFSAPSDYADMISKLLLVFMQSIGLDRELEGNNAGDLVDDRADIGDFDISNAVRLGFAEQDKIRQRISLQEFQSMKGRIREDGGRYLLFDFGRRNRLKNLSGVPPVISSLERKIAEGSIIIDENGNLIENQRYNPVQDITDILSKESKNKEFFKQGDIIRHLLNNRLSFKSLSLNFDGYIGQMQVLSGVMRLPDGYLSVKVICNPEDNQIYGVDSEFVDISGKGREISVSELMDIFKIKEKEVPEISEKEKAYINKKLERKPLKSKFHFQSLGSAVYRGQMAGVVTYDERMLDKSKIWFVSQIAPDDRTAMSKAGGVVTNGGNRYSHIGVLTREAKVPSVFLSQSVMQSGEMTVPVFETVEEKDVNGFTMVIVKQTNRAIKEGDFVIIDGDRIYVLNEEERRQFEADRKIPVDRQEIEYAISDNLETAERMLDRKNAVKSLEAYTIILKTERILKDTKIRVNQDIQVRLDELKRQSIDSIRSFAKEVIVDAEGILRLKVNLKREQIDALFKYQRMITYWQSFYGLVRIDELMQRINERIESIKKTAGAMKSLDEMGVEYENDIGSKAANIIFLRKIFNGKKFNG